MKCVAHVCSDTEFFTPKDSYSIVTFWSLAQVSRNTLCTDEVCAHPSQHRKVRTASGCGRGLFYGKYQHVLEVTRKTTIIVSISRSSTDIHRRYLPNPRLQLCQCARWHWRNATILNDAHVTYFVSFTVFSHKPHCTENNLSSAMLLRRRQPYG
jgi:hypothetical protein